jgi:uncharacterized protein
VAAQSPRFISRKIEIFRCVAWQVSVFGLLVFLGGCAKKPPTTTELREVTRDLVSAAKKAAGREAQIVIQPEMSKSGNGRARLIADDIFIQLPAGAKTTAVEAALDRAGARYGLARTPRSATSETIRFDYSLNGTRTHTIEILMPVASASKSQSALVNGNAPRLAIIIDDLGSDLAPAEKILSLPYPLTLSILPGKEHSVEIAEEAFRRGDQVILHLPMEAEGNAVKPEAVELRVGMSAEEVDSVVSDMLASVPYAIGVNNHEGSRATADPQLMAEVMSVLRARNLFFVDSRTTAATVAFDAASQAGVPAASRKVFLDDVEAREAVLGQLDLAARDATRDGSAIAIGHPHPVTLAALAEGLPKLQAQGIRLVFVSSLVQ